MCACFLYHLTCDGRRGWFTEGWSVPLLTATYYNAEAQTAHPQAWCHWLGIEEPGGAHMAIRFTGGLN